MMRTSRKKRWHSTNLPAAIGEDLKLFSEAMARYQVAREKLHLKVMEKGDQIYCSHVVGTNRMADARGDTSGYTGPDKWACGGNITADSGKLGTGTAPTWWVLSEEGSRRLYEVGQVTRSGAGRSTAFPHKIAVDESLAINDWTFRRDTALASESPHGETDWELGMKILKKMNERLKRHAETHGTCKPITRLPMYSSAAETIVKAHDDIVGPRMAEVENICGLMRSGVIKVGEAMSLRSGR